MNPNILTPVFPDEFTFNDAPGLGFDFPHLAAVSGNRPFRFGFGEGFRSGFGNGFGFSGFLLSPSVIVVDGQPGEPAPAEEGVSPEQVEAQGAAGADRRYSTAPYPSPYSSGGGAPGAGASASAQQTQSEEYVFVRRDGGLVFAVAYSWDRDGLHYVTREGIRKSMAVDAIDLNATQQFNEQRGLSFRLPA